MAWAVLAVAAGVLATGCSASSASRASRASSASGPVIDCGAVRTGANVPVIIKIAKGDISCSTALAVEKTYAADIKKGELEGNGGGAPIQFNGWTCQGYSTPKVLSTGDASECHTGKSEILAMLDVPASDVTTST
jgi:hypothetical protein